MSKVMWHTTMSLDGFIAGPNDSMEWAFRSGAGPNPLADEVMRGTGVVLGGRGLARSGEEIQRGLHRYGGAWAGPVFVLTNRITNPPDDQKVTFLREAIEVGVSIGRAAAGEKNLEVFGANVARHASLQDS